MGMIQTSVLLKIAPLQSLMYVALKVASSVECWLPRARGGEAAARAAEASKRLLRMVKLESMVGMLEL